MPNEGRKRFVERLVPATLALAAVLFAAPPWVDQAAAADEKYQCSNSSGYYDTKSDCETVCPSGVCTAVSNQSVKTEQPSGSSKATMSGGAAVALTTPLGGMNLGTFIGGVVKTILGLTGVIALVMFIWGGFLWMTAGGNTDRVKKAKGTLVWSTIGLIVIFASYSIVRFILQTLEQAQ